MSTPGDEVQQLRWIADRVWPDGEWLAPRHPPECTHLDTGASLRGHVRRHRQPDVLTNVWQGELT